MLMLAYPLQDMSVLWLWLMAAQKLMFNKHVPPSSATLAQRLGFQLALPLKLDPLTERKTRTTGQFLITGIATCASTTLLLTLVEFKLTNHGQWIGKPSRTGWKPDTKATCTSHGPSTVTVFTLTKFLTVLPEKSFSLKQSLCLPLTLLAQSVQIFRSLVLIAIFQKSLIPLCSSPTTLVTYQTMNLLSVREALIPPKWKFRWIKVLSL